MHAVCLSQASVSNMYRYLFLSRARIGGLIKASFNNTTAEPTFLSRETSFLGKFLLNILLRGAARSFEVVINCLNMLYMPQIEGSSVFIVGSLNFAKLLSCFSQV